MNKFSQEEELYMQEALEQARFAYAENEVPIGAVFVYEGKIIGKGRNAVEKKKEVFYHAEMVALREASHFFGDWRLTGTTLYVTVEPCPMCLGALILARVKEVIWGCPDLRCGGDGSFCQLPLQEHPIHRLQTRSGLLAEEAKQLLQTFFQEKRKEKKVSNFYYKENIS